MGTDNLFHKRRAKNVGQLARRKPQRDSYAKILIVCEGEKTEPNYFQGAKDYYALNSANVEICGDCGSDPVSIIKYAKQCYREERDAGDAFDKIFCVFDRDAHPHYTQAMNEISGATPKNTFEAINSVPCFEYWLLLHFIHTTHPYAAQHNNSACNQVLSELRAYMPGYAKGRVDVFKELVDQLDFAIQNAIRAWQTAQANGTDNPSTQVHELIEYLKNIK